jgi:hypothetical protein
MTSAKCCHLGAVALGVCHGSVREIWVDYDMEGENISQTHPMRFFVRKRTQQSPTSQGSAPSLFLGVRGGVFVSASQ